MDRFEHLCKASPQPQSLVAKPKPLPTRTTLTTLLHLQMSRFNCDGPAIEWETRYPVFSFVWESFYNTLMSPRNTRRHRNRGLSSEYEEKMMHIALEDADRNEDWKSMATIYFIDPDLMWQHMAKTWRAFAMRGGPGFMVFDAADSQKKAVVEEFLRKRL